MSAWGTLRNRARGYGAALLLAGGVMTGQIQAIAGSAAAPGYAIGQNKTGLYTTGADATAVLGFSVNGASQGTLDAAGILTIPTQVRCNGAGTAFYAPNGSIIGAVIKATTFDTNSAVPMSVGASVATGVQVGKVGGANTMLGTMTHTLSAIGTAQTVAHTLRNATAAELGAQQYSPIFELEGQGRATDGAGASMACKWGVQAVPVQGAAAPTVALDFYSSVNAAYGAWQIRFLGSSIYLATGAFTTYDTSNQAFYGAGATSGAKVGSAGYDVHTAGPVYLGKTTASMVKAGHTGIPVHQSAHTAVPTDADMVTGGITAYLDEAGSKIKWRAKYSDGVTYKTGEVALA